MKINDEDRAVILFSCPDRRGIVAETAHFVSTYNGNIIHSSQHKDDDEGIFFMRIEWSLTDFAIPKEKIFSAFEPIALKYKMDWELKFGNERAKVAVFVSKFDHCLYELLIRYKEGDLPCDIVQIVGNHEDTRKIAEYFGIPFVCIPISPETKAAAEAVLLSVIAIKLSIFITRFCRRLSAPNRIIRRINAVLNSSAQRGITSPAIWMKDRSSSRTLCVFLTAIRFGI